MNTESGIAHVGYPSSFRIFNTQADQLNQLGVNREL